MESIGFKEWSLVCDAIGRGEQCVLLRKGGIAEGRGGFCFQHREFFLFPTFFHEQITNVRNAPGTLPQATDLSTITLYVQIEQAVHITSLVMAEALAPLHVLAPRLVAERFAYKGEGLSVAFVRAFQLSQPWSFPNEKRFGGCRSWISLPAPPPLYIQPVLDDHAHRQRRAQFHRIVSSAKTAALQS
ncbi:MAG: DUF1802 family protein [Verrucomicrobia bacterium]|nr:DUF1802 family protein [Verrucomicrobiota bacterium]